MVQIKCRSCGTMYKADKAEDMRGFKCEDCGNSDWDIDAVHANMMEFMEGNMDRQDDPEVGIFWYDPKDGDLIFVNKIHANALSFDNHGQKTIPLLHMKEWQHQKNRTKSKGKQWKYAEDWTATPRGRVWELKDEGFVVTVGSWINKYPQAKQMILEEFSLPDDTEFRYDTHWDIGSGWSGDRI